MAPNSGRWIISAVAVLTAGLAYVFDWNETHIFNQKWPPHAKFHNAQTMILSTLLGLTSLWLAWRPVGDRRRQLQAAAVVAALYWVAQLGSVLFPGTALVDPEFRDRPGAYLGGVMPIQPVICFIFISALVAGVVLENRARDAAKPQTITKEN